MIRLEAELLEHLDREAAQSEVSRSQSVRQALRVALERGRVEELEPRHRQGHERQPVETGELDVWHGEQLWPPP